MSYSTFKYSVENSIGRITLDRPDVKNAFDEHMIGGALIQAGDEVIDGSLRGKLSRMSQALTH